MMAINSRQPMTMPAISPGDRLEHFTDLQHASVPFVLQ
jgi:hypothetical protein